ncbi:MAG: SbcC/MukB-like Walker B domain-containing protein, partial [Lachnospiraceae bacterium]|nr:SbcC/MukB-like Walker B domain-containing protein [Lachnospiraceae bacterium]
KQLDLESKQIYQEIDSNKKSIKQLTAIYDAAVKTDLAYEQVHPLSDTANGRLSGSAKIDFQTYMQRRYFKRIIEAANRRLAPMSREQFTLSCRDISGLSKQGEAGLDLDVYSLSTGTYRDVKTLSGGESFLAALSMALGMADIIGQEAGKVEVDTLFIDEGFGSLDEESRRQAMEVIASLTEGSRLVGLISHVTELKEQIGRKLIISKGNDGSHCRWEYD